jgi:hypothetical protein
MEKYLDKYYEKFGEALPTYQIARTRTEDEVIAIIEECISKGKDVYELGYCTLDDDVQY